MFFVKATILTKTVHGTGSKCTALKQLKLNAYKDDLPNFD